VFNPCPNHYHLHPGPGNATTATHMATQSKVYDLELVGVPARRPTRWRGPILFGLGLAVGGAVAALHGVLTEPDNVPVLRREPASTQIEQKMLRDQLSRADQRIASLTRQLDEARQEAGNLRSEAGDLREALALADKAIAAAERERVLWEQRGGLPGNGVNPNAERSPPPSSARRYVTGGFEESPSIDRIFIAKTPGITLQDIARRYGVSMNALKAVNPGLTIKRTRDGDFVRQGAQVNIPFRE